MSQNDFNIANQGFPATRADINSALQALASNSAGATAPSTTYAYQMWYDETADLLKMRNSDNDAWITLAAFDQATDEWEIRTAVIQAVDSAGVVIKTDDGTVRISVDDNGNVTIANDLSVGGDLSVTGDLTVSGQASTASVLPSADATSVLGGASNRYTNLFLSGGVYLGGTGSANLLDDYEEGTFTATLTPQTSGTITLEGGEKTCNYTKIGSLVHIGGLIIVDTVSSPIGEYVEFALPFLPADLTDLAGRDSGPILVRVTSSGSPSEFFYHTVEGNFNARIYYENGNAAPVFQAGTNVYVSLTYRTSQ